MSSKYNFSGKVALVTGSSSGIGAAIAIQLTQHGASVIITGRDALNLNQIAQQIEQLSGRSVLQIIGDLLDTAFTAKLIQKTVERFGKLDFVVNNAGGGTPNESFDAEDLLEQYDRVMSLNVRSVLQLTQLAVPYLEKSRGAVVNVSSIASVQVWGLIYCTSKAALDMLTKTSANQLAPKGIRVNSVNPGPVYTEIGRSVGQPNLFTEKEAFIKGVSPLKRIAAPEEIANVVCFLLSDEACNMTGSIVVCDGGILVRTT